MHSNSVATYAIHCYQYVYTQIYVHSENMSDKKEDLKKAACDAIDALAEELHALSDDIWKNPELGLEETHAHEVLTSFLRKHEFKTEKSYKMETAFRATYGDGSPNVVFISEYDALPGIGHACGHNLIAEVGIAAGLGLKAAITTCSKPLGKVTVFGTPAEEVYGGKIDLISSGAFEDVDVAMMAHPFPDNDATPIMLATETLEITYTGTPSHAAGYPWEGVNALDAAVLCYQGIACLRQQIKPTWRIHCIIKEGGVKTNIIPERSVLETGVRAPTNTELAQLKAKVVECIKAAATASGCQMTFNTVNRPYASMLHNKIMTELYQTNMSPMLPAEVPIVKGAICGSSDMGNVAHVVPSIHPNYHIGGREVNHTRGFTKDAGDPKAQSFTLIQAKALAMTAIDIMWEDEVLINIKSLFDNDMKHTA